MNTTLLPLPRTTVCLLALHQLSISPGEGKDETLYNAKGEMRDALEEKMPSNGAAVFFISPLFDPLRIEFVNPVDLVARKHRAGEQAPKLFPAISSLLATSSLCIFADSSTDPTNPT
ncbi:hypothetical protein FF1_034396 [Malus domestica]